MNDELIEIDPTEPRCDECGVHCEEADEWDGECGNCGDHCLQYEGCPPREKVDA